MTDHRPRHRAKDERGGSLVLMLLSLLALLGMAALAVDVSMGFTARNEAQRAADAAALAGASAFLDYRASEASGPAADRAVDYATRNDVRNETVDPAEVDVQVIPDSMKVRVRVFRDGLPTWFARVLGVDAIDIGALAAAQATEAGASRCLKPFALPDMWHDEDDDDDGDRVWDAGEEWALGSHPDDRYVPYSGPDGSADATGYGSSWRGSDRDYGRGVQIKVSDPNSEYQASPGIFLPWRLPLDDDMEECDQAGGGAQDAGAATYRQNICSCNDTKVELGTPYDVEPGNMLGPTHQGVDELIAEDPEAYWGPTAADGRGGIVNSAYGSDGMNSPRVIKVALFDPRQIDGSGMQTITFNNFALLFLEEQTTMKDPITARFLYFVSGEESDSDGETTGSLVRYLRLVE